MAPTEPLRFPVSLSVNPAQESVIAYSLSASEVGRYQPAERAILMDNLAFVKKFSSQLPFRS